MGRAFLIFLVVFYVVPLSLAPAGHTFVFILLQVTLLLSGLLGLFSPLVFQFQQSRGRVRLPHHASFSISSRTIFFLFFLYGVAKSPSYFESVSLLLNGANVLGLMQEKSIERYSDSGESFGALFNIGTAIVYAISSLIVHFLAGSSSSHRVKALAVSLLLLSLFLEILDGSRTRVLLCAVFLLVEILILANHRFGSVRLSRFLLLFLFAVLSLLIVFLIPQYARVFNRPDALEIVFTIKLPNYTISMYDAFFLWLSQQDGSLGWGYNSFSFVFKAFGSTYTPGLYLPISTSFGDTNIYTILRPIIADFGVVAPAIFFFVAGYCASYLGFFHGSLMGSLIARIPVVLFFYPLYSAFYFTTTGLGFALFFTIAIFVGRR